MRWLGGAPESQGRQARGRCIPQGDPLSPPGKVHGGRTTVTHYSEQIEGIITTPGVVMMGVMTHKYRGSQQSSRKVLPKFIDSTQGEPKNICKP
jgi:hypothetical protein